MRELSLHVLDVMENAIEAGASRIEVVVDEDPAVDRLVIEVSDNGRGMSKAMAERVLDPFFTTRKTRHVGLGLPLFAAAAERCDGRLTVESEVGKGTRVRATFRHSHIDRAPLGDMPSALMAILLSGRPVDLAYVHRLGDAEFRFDSAEVRRELGDVPLTYPAVRRWLWQTLREGEESLRADPTERESPDRGKR